jgi:hypothetical protein
VTRSIGDLIGHVIGLNSVAFIKEYDITHNDTSLLDSRWEWCGRPAAHCTSGLKTFYLLTEDSILNDLIMHQW